MTINPDLIAPCGLYCGVCAIYIAHRDNNLKFKERLVNLYKGAIPDKGTLPNSEKLSIKDIQCRGCLSDEQFRHCRQCEIRACTIEKGYTGCHQCDEFPCQYEIFEKCSVLFKFKEGENFNRRNTVSISRIKI